MHTLNHTILPLLLRQVFLLLFLTCTALFLFSCLSSFPSFFPSLTHFLSLTSASPSHSLLHSTSIISNLFLPHIFFLPHCSQLSLPVNPLLLSFPFSPLSLVSLRCRMLWAMSCHGSILSLSSSSVPFSFSISFWGC